MNREILFRGKQIVSGEWIYGVPISNDNITCIFKLTDGLSELKGFQVKPETVGQYTGLIDKNGVKIFEGDIINVVCFDEFGEACECKGYYLDDIRTTSVNGWLEFADKIEAIGNIHDNPELLGD